MSCIFFIPLMGKKKMGSFPFVPPSLVGAYYLPPPPDARPIFLHDDLLCNDTSSVTGGRITYSGAQRSKKCKFPN